MTPLCLGSSGSCLALAHSVPDLAKQFHPTKNGDLTPHDITPGSGKKVWWIGPGAHTWLTSVLNRSKGRGCPYCSNRLVLAGFNDLATTHPEIARDWHPDKNDGKTAQDVIAGSGKLAWWLGRCGHEWDGRIGERSRSVRGAGCPYCSNKRILLGFNDLASTHPPLARQWHPTRNGALTPHSVVAGTKIRVWWVGTCGHEWRAGVQSRALQNTACPFCANMLVLPGFNDLATTHPALALEWHPNRNGLLTPEAVLAGGTKKVWWRGACGHD